MSNQYGPWATSIDTGGNPQLSTFWRKRLTLLLPTSRTSPALSRRHLFWLAVAAAAMIVLPTFRLATAEEPASAKKATAANPPPGEITGSYVTSAVKTGEPSDEIWVPVPIYAQFLIEKADREQLKITAEQEAKLREIALADHRRSMNFRDEMYKDAATLTSEQRNARRSDFRALQTKESKAARRQIDELLTPEQRTSLRSMNIAMLGIGWFMSDNNPERRKSCGITEEHVKQWERFCDGERDKEKRLKESQRLLDDSMLAVLTPQQWEQFERGDVNTGRSYLYPPGELILLCNSICPDVDQRLGINAEQRAKLHEIAVQSHSNREKLNAALSSDYPYVPQKEREAQAAEFQRNAKAQAKEDLRQIESVLTKQQAIDLKKLLVRNDFLGDIRMPGFFERSKNDKRGPAILDQVHASKKQKDELRRLCDEKVRQRRQRYLAFGQGFLKLLSPEQQEMCIAVIEDHLVAEAVSRQN